MMRYPYTNALVRSTTSASNSSARDRHFVLREEIVVKPKITVTWGESI